MGGGIQPPDLKLFPSHRYSRCVHLGGRRETSTSTCTRAQLLTPLPGEGRSAWVSSGRGQGVSQALFVFSLPLTRSVFAAQQPGLRPGVPVEQQREHQGGPGVRAPRAARQLRDEPRPGGRRVAAARRPSPGAGRYSSSVLGLLVLLGGCGGRAGGV